MPSDPRTIRGPCFDCDDGLDDAWEFCPCHRQGLRSTRKTAPTPKLGVSQKRVRTWALNKKEAAQIRRAVLRFGLDRRRVYTIGHDNGLEVVCHFTGSCSGCACDCHPGCSHGAGGCSECGYTGKRRQSFGDPVRIPGHGFVVCAGFRVDDTTFPLYLKCFDGAKWSRRETPADPFEEG